MKYRKLRLTLWKWHRRLGLVAALFLVWLAISGLLLNHSSSLDLDSRSLPNFLAESIAPLTEVSTREVQISSGQLSQSGSGLSLNGRGIGTCEGGLIGVVQQSSETWVGCRGGLIVLDPAGRLVEQLSAYQGLPTPVERLGRCSGAICIAGPDAVYQLQNFDWRPYQGEARWAPVPVVSSVERIADASVANWERFILEAHSGRSLGSLGVLLVDLAAIASILLAASGAYVWWSHRRRQKKAEDD